MKSFLRDEDGLIGGGLVNYVFNEDGTVNWRKMVKPEYLVPNRQRTKETDVSKLEDKDLLILLGGIKELAQIRGFSDVTYRIAAPSPEYVVMTCKIQWIPNFETGGKEIGFSAVGDASPFNTNSFAKIFLGPIAENRSFVRCVRNFLKINIVSQEEMGNVKLPEESPSQPQENIADPKIKLEKLMTEKDIPFSAVKKKLIEEKVDGASEFNSIQDVPRLQVFELIERLQKYKK
jgi:hypothetical protein